MSDSTDADTSVRSTDRRAGERVPASDTSISSVSQKAQQPQQQQQQEDEEDGEKEEQEQQHSNTQQKTPINFSAGMAAYFASQPQTSSAPYQQPRHLVFGQPLRTSAPAHIVLDDAFRAAAKKDPMLWGFMRASDRLAEMNGRQEQPGQNGEQRR